MSQFSQPQVRTLVVWARFLQSLSPGPPQAGFIVFHNPKGIAMSETIVTADQEPLNASVRFLDAHGNETTADDVPVWSSSDPSVAEAEPDEDGLSAVVTITGKAGATVVSVETTEQDSNEAIRAEGTLTVRASSTSVSGEVTFDVESVEQPPGDQPPIEEPPGEEQTT